MRSPRERWRGSGMRESTLDDPLSGVANLFDASLAFIVALLIVLFGVWGMLDLFDPGAEFTLVKQNSDGTLEIITKTAEEIRVQEITDTELEGQGVRLGTAYRLADGRVVYVADGPASP